MGSHIFNQIPDVIEKNNPNSSIMGIYTQLEIYPVAFLSRKAYLIKFCQYLNIKSKLICLTILWHVLKSNSFSILCRWMIWWNLYTANEAGMADLISATGFFILLFLACIILSHTINDLLQASHSASHVSSCLIYNYHLYWLSHCMLNNFVPLGIMHRVGFLL